MTEVIDSPRVDEDLLSELAWNEEVLCDLRPRNHSVLKVGPDSMRLMPDCGGEAHYVATFKCSHQLLVCGPAGEWLVEALETASGEATCNNCKGHLRECWSVRSL